jgi:hypothetical protein
VEYVIEEDKMTDKALPKDVPFTLPEEKKLPGFFERLLAAPRKIAPFSLF